MAIERVEKMNEPHKQDVLEEIFNSVTCGVGLCLSIAALVILVVLAGLHGDALRVVSFSIYGASLVLLFLFSTLYHCFQPGKVKHVFEILDHCAIYILIAGTYTPFALVTLKGAWGWSLFGVIWALALAGILFKSFFIKKFRALSVVIYLLMGWFVVVAIRPLTQHLAVQGVVWLAAGGVIFSLGAVFYAFKKLPFHHTLWHVFVLAGCACHFFSILFYVLPA